MQFDHRKTSPEETALKNVEEEYLICLETVTRAASRLLIARPRNPHKRPDFHQNIPLAAP
jgi:hypothetical protein